MTEHLSDLALNSFIDDELPPIEATTAGAHLAACPACTSKALSCMMLKSRTAQAGRRYTLPPQLLNRLPVHAPAPSARTSPSWVPWIGAIAAVLIVIVGMTLVQRRATERAAEAALVAELTDQHVSTMAANQPPEVVSSDRHTVKPWFQGKIPFSFSLPEPLPPDSTLDGANLAYLGHRPVAQLLYSIGRHKVSVFIRDAESAKSPTTLTDLTTDQSGFHLRSFRTSALDVVAVSDVEPAKLDALTTAIRNAQTR